VPRERELDFRACAGSFGRHRQNHRHIDLHALYGNSAACCAPSPRGARRISRSVCGSPCSPTASAPRCTDCSRSSVPGLPRRDCAPRVGSAHEHPIPGPALDRSCGKPRTL
jgi:hypothetical protein